MDPYQVEKFRNEAYARFQSGNIDEAREIALKILDKAPEHGDSLYLLGVISHGEKKIKEALEWISKAVQSAPKNAVFWNSLGELHLDNENQKDAEYSFQQSIIYDPGYARAFNNLGRLKMLQKDNALARLFFEKATLANPNYAIAFNNLGVVFQGLRLHDDAKVSFGKALNIRPNYPEAHFNIANTLFNLGDVFGAIEHYQKAINNKPDYAKAYFQMGLSFQQLRRDFDALVCFQNAVKLNPNDAEMLTKLGDHLLVKQDWKEAIEVLEKAIEINPNAMEGFTRLCHARQLVCDWSSYQDDLDLLWKDAEIKIGKGECPAVGPFQSLTVPWSLDRLQMIARMHSAKTKVEIGVEKLHQFDVSKNDSSSRLRIGYLSGDFYNHPVSHLLHGFFGRHDLKKFEVFVYSFSQKDDSDFRKRIENESEHFINVAGKNSKEIGQQIASDNIHILVDLMGYTGFNRVASFAMRSAPIQVSFLGMLGTMGADFFDYIITDSFLTPEDYQVYFDEKFVVMPHSYLIAELEPEDLSGKVDREKYGLPASGFVFCSFNNSYKIEPSGFSIWMRILKQVPGSVLWLAGQSGGALLEQNLRKEATRCGVDDSRLIFAGFLSRNEHLKRHQVADLFLDSFVYNAAATSSLALQLGLPVITCPGDTFASRVGASLLNSAGLSECIAKDPTEYESLAVKLANDPNLLQLFRTRLLDNRSKSPLFDTSRFVGNLEKAYSFMWKNYKAGNTPKPHKVQE
jgi:predicted O-linked N-acetylglucosamine transferase (SPINDLY family)